MGKLVIFDKKKSDDASKINVQLRLKGIFLTSHYGRVYSY